MCVQDVWPFPLNTFLILRNRIAFLNKYLTKTYQHLKIPKSLEKGGYSTGSNQNNQGVASRALVDLEKKSFRIQICPEKGIIAKIPLLGWDRNPRSYCRAGSGFLKVTTWMKSNWTCEYTAPLKLKALILNILPSRKQMYHQYILPWYKEHHLQKVPF